MDISRRWFIGGVASFGAFGGCRFLSCHDYRAGGTPNIRFGVVSDIHITKVGAGEKMEGWGNNLTFRHTLEWFREQGVDAVMIAGDMADNGMDDHIMAVAEAWYSVFPGDRYPDGRPVEKVFVYGNHDWHGFRYGDYALKRYPDEAERVRHILQADMGGWWKRAFHEDYAPLYAKEIRGYTFIGCHWDRGCGYPQGDRGGTDPFRRLSAYMGEHGKAIDPSLPFFYVQHPHPKDTCYGPWAWGFDEGLSTTVLSQFPNAIALSGHSHYTLTDDRSVWQGAFTSIGCGCLRYQDIAGEEFAATGGFENGSTPSSPKAKELNAAKLLSKLNLSRDRTGLVMDVYDDRLVIERRDFVNDVKLGDDWVVPLPAGTGGPMDFAVRKSKAPVPRFAADAKIERAEGWSSCRGSKEKLAVKTVTFPAAVAADGTRAYRYVIRITDAAGSPVAEKNVVAPDFCRTKSSPSERITCLFPAIPSDARIIVTPYNVFGASGPELKVVR